MFSTQTQGLVGYTDADGATQEHRHTIMGFTFLIDGGAILWGSKKQELITLSTTKSEYIVATHTTKEVIWLRHLIGKMFRPLQHPTILYGDNQSAIIALTKDGSFHAHIKHTLTFGIISFVSQSKMDIFVSFTAQLIIWLQIP